MKMNKDKNNSGELIKIGKTFKSAKKFNIKEITTKQSMMIKGILFISILQICTCHFCPIKNIFFISCIMRGFDNNVNKSTNSLINKKGRVILQI